MIEKIGDSILNAAEYTIAQIGLRAAAEVCVSSNELEGDLQTELHDEAQFIRELQVNSQTSLSINWIRTVDLSQTAGSFMTL